MRYAERSSLLYNLESFYKQKPNRRNLLFGPVRLWRHYKYLNRDTKMARQIKKRLTESPVLYDESLTEKTAKSLQNYLRRKGYFKATCTYKADTVDQWRMRVQYTLTFEQLYTMDSVSYFSRDTNLLRIMEDTWPQTNLKQGEALDGEVFESERQRITNEFRNRGYANFGPNFIDFGGDSTGSKANIKVEALTVSDTSFHHIFRIGSVSVYYSLIPDVTSVQNDAMLEGIYFVSADREFEVKPKFLLPGIAMRPGNIFRQTDLERTQRALNALGVFRFVSVKSVQDSVSPNTLNVEISLTPNKRFSIGTDIDLNSSNSNSTSVAPQLLGVSATPGFRNRNIFGGAELWQSNLAYNIQFDISNARDQLIFSEEFQFQNSLTYPRFFDYFGFWRGLHKVHFGKKRLINDNTYERLRTSAQPQFNLDLNFIELRNLYSYNSFTAKYGFKIQAGGNNFNVTHIGIDLLRPRLQPLFDTLTLRNPFLRQSFINQLFTGFLLRSVTYRFGTTPNRFGERWYFSADGELSGAEVHAANQLWSALFGKQEWRIADIEFARYLRMDVNGGYIRELRPGLVIATRMGAGVISSFGPRQETPYIKQYSGGGPFSLRGWRIREPGPGRFIATDGFLNFYQAADFRFECNAEVRFPLFSYLRGAVFFDAGNIWALRPDPARPGAELRWNSYQNIAVNTGLGFRLDVEYFVIRLDLGLKLRQPFPDDTNNYWIYNSPTRLSRISLGDFTPSLAVGYPF